MDYTLIFNRFILGLLGLLSMMCMLGPMLGAFSLLLYNIFNIYDKNIPNILVITNYEKINDRIFMKMLINL